MMSVHTEFVPHLATVHKGPLFAVENTLLSQVPQIESWFREQWLTHRAPLTSSVDLRHSGFKIAPVDTNLFPAGFNNLNPEFLPLCIQAVQAAINERMPTCNNILLLPENHTRNAFYLQSLAVLRDILLKAGFLVRVGSLDETLTEPKIVHTERSESFAIEPLLRQGERVSLPDFDPCLIVLNNDLSSGMPPILDGIRQRVSPTSKLGWSSRLKSNHFGFYQQAAQEFAASIGLDAWLITPYFKTVSDIDFMAQEGIDALAYQTQQLLDETQKKYEAYGIEEQPFAVVKADNGTYGMSVMMVHDADSLRHLNRKQRTKMAASKGSQKVGRVIIQEGVRTVETMPDGAVAEPVVYMIGSYVVGGFYRVHKGRGKDENLNAPGMHFEPLAFEQACNVPQHAEACVASPNRFYVYGVIARLAALAAAREILAVGE